MTNQQIETAPALQDFEWLEYLKDAAILHLGSEVAANNELAVPFLANSAVLAQLQTVSEVTSQLHVGDTGTLWSLDSKWLDALQCWLTQFRPALESNLAKILLENPRPILIHDNFKPLFANPAYVELFQLNSLQRLLAMDSIRPLIGEEHWPNAVENYQRLMSEGYLVSEPVSVSWSCMGTKLQTRIHDFVIDWFGKRVLCTTIHDVGRDQNSAGRYHGMAFTDPLTRLGNQRRFNEQGASELLQSLNQDTIATVVVTELDNFKAINEKYGHAVGDLVLQFLAKLLRGFAGERSLIARIKQDHFALFVAAKSNHAGVEWAKALKQRIDCSPFMLADGETIQIELSVGLSQWCGGEDHLAGIYTRAVDGVSKAQQNGGNQLVIV